MNDLIIRQAAIDAIENTDWYHQNDNGDMVSGANPDEHQAWYKAADVYSALKSVPSAQPERKKPVFKTGESVYHVSYADGTGGFKKKQMGRLDLP